MNGTGTFTPELTLAANGNLTMVGSTITTSGSASTYGAITVSGAKGGWSGINFYASGNQATLMVSGDTVGFYNAALSGWDWLLERRHFNPGNGARRQYFRRHVWRRQLHHGRGHRHGISHG